MDCACLCWVSNAFKKCKVTSSCVLGSCDQTGKRCCLGSLLFSYSLVERLCFWLWNCWATFSYLYIHNKTQTNKQNPSDTKILPNVFSELVCQEWGVWLCTSDGHCHHLRNCKWIYKQESLTGKITPQICIVPQECAQECLDLLAQCKDLRYKKMENLIMFFESVVLQRSP